MTENYWGDLLQETVEKTDNIITIMEEQCRFLSEATQNKVSAVFDVVDKKNELIESILKPILDVTASKCGTFPVLQDKETVGEISIDDRFDASGMFYRKHYAFELYTNTYRYRLFDLILTPSYPIEITIDNGISNDIYEKVIKFKKPNMKNNSMIINSESEFRIVLKHILQNRRVKYIVNQMMKRSDNELIEAKEQTRNGAKKKIIICEGQTDEIILQTLARKVERTITTINAGGKQHIPALINSVLKEDQDYDILIVVDSDGDEEGTRSHIQDKIAKEACKIVIINNCIEDMFNIDTAHESKYQIAKSIVSALDDLDIEDKKSQDKSFKAIVDFILE